MIGKLNMFVEPGTVLGPTYTNEFITAYLPLPRAEGYEGPDATTFRHTQSKDFQNIREPRSVTEYKMMQVQPSIFGPVRSTDIIEYHRPEDMGKVYGGQVLPARLGRGEGRNGKL